MEEHEANSPANADREWLGGPSATILAENGELEIAGKRYFTADRLAMTLGVTERTLSRWDAARIGPPKIKIGKLVLFDVDKLPDWLAARETAPVRVNRAQPVRGITRAARKRAPGMTTRLVRGAGF
ncbi:MAG: hypothetical protein JOY71_23220 [Acetobacteraceae bacterium]|nr:hypothetical protein [Acetobacteraceae bacterium]MBV8524994.1 hypothetical protein [Acetobacteraceae bacterium]